MRVASEARLPIGLPAGMRCARAGESIERADGRSCTVRLLANGDGTEVAAVTFAPDERLTLLPAGGDGSLSETYYLLSGGLVWHGQNGDVSFTEGDTITVDGLAEPVVLTAVGEVRFLYVASQPSFYQTSDLLGETMRLAEEVEIADGYTAGHCLRLQRLAYATGETLGLQGARLLALDHGAFLHDLGKIKIPRSVLQKPGPLTAEEGTLVKRHPVSGREILEGTSLRHAAPVVGQHHERIDGSGYPYGLSGDEVLIEASIVAVAGHNPERDVHVNVDTGVGKNVTDALPINAVGEAPYNAQESVQNTVSKTTGTSVDHYCIWIGVNGQNVPVDRFCASN